MTDERRGASAYGVEQDAAGPGFSRAIVMELVDGEDLWQPTCAA